MGGIIQRLIDLESEVNSLRTKIDLLCDYFLKPVSAVVEIGCTFPKGSEMSRKKLVKSGPPVNITDLQSAGATLTVLDAAGLPVTFDATTMSVAWASSDTTVLVVAPAAGNPASATVSTATPVKSGTATISATVTASGTALPVATSPPITVTGSTPASADITIAVNP